MLSGLPTPKLYITTTYLQNCLTAYIVVHTDELNDSWLLDGK